MTKKQEFNSVYGDIAGRDVVHHTTVQIAQQTINHHYPALPAQLARHAPPTHAVPAAAPLTLAQKKLLSLMKPLAKLARIEVLDFMRQNYGTAMVRELEPQALARVHLFVLSLQVSIKG